MNMREATNFGFCKLGFNEIRDNQRKVVEAYLSGRDVLIILPTASEKSLTFHISPFTFNFFETSEAVDVKTVCLLVISPLVSLTKDQVLSLCKKGID